MSRMDLNDDDEKKLIDGIFRNAVDSLTEDDKKLPQVLLNALLGCQCHTTRSITGGFVAYCFILR